MLKENNTDKLLEKNLASDVSRGIGLGLTISSFLALGIGG